MLLCFAPIILAGAIIPIETPWHHSSIAPSAIVEVLTCQSGPGLHARATESGLFAGGVQYGFTKDVGKVSFSISPQAGISYVDHPVRNLPARTQYEVGLQALVCYDRFCSGLSYIHMSNGYRIGLCPSGDDCRGNIGEDVLAITTGLRFH